MSYLSRLHPHSHHALVNIEPGLNGTYKARIIAGDGVYIATGANGKTPNIHS